MVDVLIRGVALVALMIGPTMSSDSDVHRFRGGGQAWLSVIDDGAHSGMELRVDPFNRPQRENTIMKRITVTVYGSDGHPLPDAKFSVPGIGDVPATYDAEQRIFTLEVPDAPGQQVVIAAAGYSERRITISRDCASDQGPMPVVLPRAGELLLFHGCVASAFRPHDEVIWAGMKPFDAEAETRFQALLDRLGLVEDSAYTTEPKDPMRITLGRTPTLREQGVRFLKKRDGGAFDRADCRELAALRSSDLVAGAGVVMSATEHVLQGVGTMLLVKPLPTAGEERMRRELRAAGLRAEPHSAGPDLWAIEADPGAGYAVCDIARRLSESGAFATVEDMTTVTVHTLN